MNGKGCRVGEQAARCTETQEIISSYLCIKEVPIFQQNEALTTKYLDQAGLLDNFDLLLSLEHVYYQHRAKLEHSDAARSLARKRAVAKQRGDD